MGNLGHFPEAALIGYPRVQNVLSFDSHFDSHRRKKRNACSLLNTSYNVVTKQYIFFLRITAFPAFLAETEVTDSS